MKRTIKDELVEYFVDKNNSEPIQSCAIDIVNDRIYNVGHTRPNSTLKSVFIAAGFNL
jgi:hypothetical protein